VHKQQGGGDSEARNDENALSVLAIVYLSGSGEKEGGQKHRKVPAPE
jgi:hypothetical protein